MKVRISMMIGVALLFAACRGEHNSVTGGYGSGMLSGRVVVSGLANPSPTGVEVSVRGTGMTAVLDEGGTFAFSGVPENAELVFRRADGIDTSLAVEARAQFLTIELTPNGARSGKRRSASRGSGGKHYEFEGPVVSASATELTMISSRRGEVTVALNEQTVVRHGQTPVDPATLAPGTRVHVKAREADGVFTAFLVIVQNAAGDDGEEEEPKPRREYEGVVRSASATELVIFDSHKEEVTFAINAATVIRKGNTPVAPEDLKADDRVHVKASTEADGTRTALLVIVQKQGKS